MSDDTSSDPIDLRDLLSKTAGDFPDRPDLPAAKTFFGKLISVAADRSRQKQTPLLRFSVRLTDPGKDVTASEMERITKEGFTLADYDTTAEYYLTPAAMPMLRRFLETIGMGTNVSFIDFLKLDPQTCLPTSETQEVIRGQDVIARTQSLSENGRVYLRLDSVAGVKRD